MLILASKILLEGLTAKRITQTKIGPEHMIIGVTEAYFFMTCQDLVIQLQMPECTSLNNVTNLNLRCSSQCMLVFNQDDFMLYTAKKHLVKAFTKQKKV